MPVADVLALVAAGELDVMSSDSVLGTWLQEVSAAGARIVELDLAGVSFIDSSGLGALVALRNATTAAGSTLTVAAASPVVVRALAATGLDGLLASGSHGG